MFGTAFNEHGTKFGNVAPNSFSSICSPRTGDPRVYFRIMTPETDSPQNLWPTRRLVRLVGWGVLFVILVSTGWYFGLERPEERAEVRQAAELATQRITKARSIPDLGLDLIWIAPGDFMMGTPPQGAIRRWLDAAQEKLSGVSGPAVNMEDNERPETIVKLAVEFWLGETVVTQAQWQAVMATDPSHFKGRDQPVETVSWNDATEFCRKLTERERTAGRLPVGYRFTLPTEEQWEYACRAGTTGDDAGSFDAVAWQIANSGATTHPVGTKRPNAWGLFDIQGNVWEWCEDWYAPYPGATGTFPVYLPAGSRRVLRGGSWDDDAERCRPAFRYALDPNLRLNNVGFRVALSSAR
jgi:formylglycine-generating enzyme required for sulfatase activity